MSIGKGIAILGIAASAAYSSVQLHEAVIWVPACIAIVLVASFRE